MCTALSIDTSDLYFDIQEDGLGGCGLTEQGFARLWAQTRGSVGVEGGRYYYQVRVEENKDVQLSETEEHPHAIRYPSCACGRGCKLASGCGM